MQMSVEGWDERFGFGCFLLWSSNSLRILWKLISPFLEALQFPYPQSQHCGSEFLCP